jgi:DNA-binding transcriptional MerR regulator/methylmalonyl-CoA mutase cobalamin-binding subunit
MLGMSAKRGVTVARHPIRVVSQRTGLTPDVLRAWEKRYGVVEPQRTERGQRLYTDADVARLRLLRQVTDAGRSIGRVAGLTEAQLSALVDEDERQRLEADRAQVALVGEDAAEHVRSALDAVEALAPGRLEVLLMQAAVRLGSGPFLERVVVPLMTEVGERWQRGRLGVATEHATTLVVKRVVGWLMRPWSDEGSGPVVVVATPAGQRHELGALLVAALASEQGWSVVYLGSDVPAEDIANTAKRRQARLVALSAVYPAGDARVARELKELGRALGGGIGLVMGGSAAPSYGDVIREAGGVVLPDLRSLGPVLDGYQRTPAVPGGVGP